MTQSLRAVLPAVEQLLQRQIGLNAESVGRDRIAHAVRSRMAHHALDGNSYLQRLLHSEEERHALIDEVVVPETWFFRDRQAFRCLRRQVQGHRSLFRVLSVPCCTGEEPYSIAMLLLDAGAGQFEVVGTDISQAALTAAASASYAEMSFRETDAEFVAMQDRFCPRQGTRRVVTEEARARVRFLQANLAGPLFLEAESPFYAIFCRNLFIYLDEPARRTALAHLRRLLLPGGLLYLSAVEAGLLLDSGFRRQDAETPCVFTLPETPGGLPRPSHARKPVTPRQYKPDAQARDITPSLARRAGVPTPEQYQPDAQARDATPSLARRAGLARPQEAATPRDGIEESLAKARRAADAGRLEEAAALCIALVAQGPPRPEVFYLLGVVRQAQGDLAEAERCYQRTLYLDFRHNEALVHLALLARQRGEERLANNFFRRAGRTGEGD